MYGHVYQMAQAVVEGAQQDPGAEVPLYQVAELIPDDVLEKQGAKTAKAAFSKVPVATVDQLADAHAIHLWHSNALRQYGHADAQFPRPDETPVGQRDR
jgi:multimeric flavodoxin WrbA